MNGPVSAHPFKSRGSYLGGMHPKGMYSTTYFLVMYPQRAAMDYYPEDGLEAIIKATTKNKLY